MTAIELVLPLEVAASAPGRGDCFDVALALARENLDLLVCHGRPIGRGPENFGRRYWHAWCETVTPAGPVVLDFSNGGRIVLKRTAYYRAGQIDPTAVLRWGRQDAAKEALTRGHFGPWSDEWDPLDPDDI